MIFAFSVVSLCGFNFHVLIASKLSTFSCAYICNSVIFTRHIVSWHIVLVFFKDYYLFI